VKTVDPHALASRIKCPVYLVHGTADQLITTEHSKIIFSALGGEKELWMVEGVPHARAGRRAKREYSRRLREFFTEKLSGRQS
jgi:uncharacterized protein